MDKITRNVRQSNLELLRVLSMLFVLMVHIDGASLGLPQVGGEWTALTGRDFWKLIVESITIIGVNCFTLISGYFGIKLNARKIGVFLFQCLFYSVGFASLAYIAFPEKYNPDYWLKSWLILTHTDYWYVPAYFILMIVSPLLDYVMLKLSNAWGMVTVLIITIVNIYCGWGLGWSFNPTGYTALQLVWVYIIGRYIGIHIQPEAIRRQRIWIAVVYLVSLAGVFISSVYLATEKAFAYNSPMVIILSVSCFLLFAGLRIQSKHINYIARSAFAAYLIHKNPLIWGNLLKPCIIRLWGILPLWAFTIAAIAVAVIFYGIAMIVDPLQRFISSRIFHRSKQ